MVAGQLHPGLGHEELRSLQRLERSGEALAEVHDLVDAAPADVLEHRAQGGQVAVDVGEDGEAHGRRKKSQATSSRSMVAEAYLGPGAALAHLLVVTTISRKLLRQLGVEKLPSLSGV